jgi:RHS repeat-associated protein
MSTRSRIWRRDTVFRYGRPAGVSTSASLFLSATDKWGVSVTMTHNSGGALIAVTHSIGGTWDLVYNTAGLLERVDDPFGRSAYFAYDTPGMLREVTDMGGLKYGFKYSTSANPVNATTTSQVFMTEIVYAPQELPYAGAANRTWHPLTYQFYTEPADNNSSGMWARYRVTTTQLHGGTEVHYFDGATTPKGWHQTAAQVAGGSSGTSYTYSVANGEGHRAVTTFPAGGTATLASYNTAGVPLSLTRRDSVALTQTVNSFEKPLTVTDPASRVTTFEYETNGMDLKKITGPDSVVALQATYNSLRLPTEITRKDGTKLLMTYNSHGQPLTTTLKDAAAATIQTTTYTYNTGDRVASVDVDGRTVASYTYDSIGRVSTITDEDAVTETFTYDSLDRVTKVTYHDSTFTERAFHGITGMVAWERDRDGQRTLYFYDPRGQMIAANAPGQRFYYWGYNNDGLMTLLIDPKGNKTTWEYDIEGRLVKKTLQDNAVEQLTWNTKSQVTQHTSPRGMKSIFTYDTLGRLTSTAYQTSTGSTAFPTESVTYDVLDRVATSVDGEGTTTYSFDTAGRLTSVDGPYGSDTVSYGYDDLSRIDEITTPGSITQSFTFDSDERLSAWSDVFGSGSITYSGRTNRVTNISRAGGLLSSSFTYTAASDLFKLAQIKHEDTSGGGSVISQFDYTWNAQQDIATWTRKLGSTADRETRFDLGHDAAHQLISATLKQVSNSAVISDQRWGVDSIGNRILEHDLVSGVRTEYSHNTTNQLVDKKTYSSGQKPWVKGSLDEPGSVSVGGKAIAVKGDNSFEGQSPTRTTTITAKDTAGNTTTENWQLNSGSGATPDSTLSYTHDSEGNLLGDGTSTFEWDLRNRLTAIVTGTHRTEFTYDGSDRRVRVVEKESGTVTSDKRYVFNDLELLEERAADNSTVLRRFYENGHVDVADSGKRYAYTSDHLGSIREVMLLDGTSGNPTTATLAARYDYDLWGKRTVLDGGSAAETLVLHGYTGHVYHSWSGLWLAPYRAYSSGIGRWISRDPIGEEGGINLYAYVENDALHLMDPLGLMSAAEFLQGATDFARGMGDTMTGGGTKIIRDWWWGDRGCVLSPNAYFGGQMAGIAVETGLGAGLGKRAAQKAVKEVGKRVVKKNGDDVGKKIAGACFVAGTKIATSNGSRDIESLRVGERVLTTSGESTTEVDPSTWSKITLQMPNPECLSDILDIEMLRSPEWLDETGCAAGGKIWLELEEIGLFGWAEVRSITACPPIQPGTGRVILSTITHNNTFVMELKLEGEAESLKPTDRHCLFSINQNAWVPASQLKAGEELRTMQGSRRIASISALSGMFRVYNLEVEGDHSYLTGSSQVLSHNATPGVPSCGAGPNGGRRSIADQARVDKQREMRRLQREKKSRAKNGQNPSTKKEKGPSGERPSGPDRSNNRERNRGIDEEHSITPKGAPPAPSTMGGR